MAKNIKKDGTYDERGTAGRQAKGKPLHPKKKEQQMQEALQNKKKKG